MMQVTIQETATTPREHPLMAPVFPRFTPQEAIILNTIASASPDYAPEEAILRTIVRTLKPRNWPGPTHQSLNVAISTIRAKLGEKSRKPVRLISVYELTPRGTRGKLVGYLWKG